MRFEDVLSKFSQAVSASSLEHAKIPRRNSLYNGDGKIINKKTGAEVQAECHQNIVFELIEAQINNAIPEPMVTVHLAEDSQRALTISNYLSNEMHRQSAIKVNDRAERGTLKNGYHFYHIEWDNSGKNNSGYGCLKLTDCPAGTVYLQPGITDFEDSEYVYIEKVATIQSIKRVYGVTLAPDTEGTDVATIVICYYLNEDGDLGRTIFAKASQQIISEDQYFELRRVAVCADCEEPIINLDNPCPVCSSERFKFKILEYETATEPIYSGSIEENARARAELAAQNLPDDPYAGLTKIVDIGDKIPFYHIRELPVVMRLSISTDESIYGKSDIDMIEQNQDTLNRITTKESENILKAGSFVTYPKGVNIPADDSTLKLVPISDPRLINAFTVQTIQANMQQDDIYAQRMYQYGRAALGITESFQGKHDTTATSGKAKQMAAAQAAGRLESKQRMKVQAYGDIYRKQFKFLLAYADETQYYVKRNSDGDILQLEFNRYMFLKRNEKTGQLYWDDNFIIEADNASLISNKQEMWQVITQQFMSGSLGNAQDPSVIKLYWDIMKQLQFPFAAAILNSISERNSDIDPALKQFLLQNPEILDRLAQMMAAEANGVDTDDNATKRKTGQTAMQVPEAANPIPPDLRLQEDINAANS